MPRPLQPGRKRQPDAIGASYPVASANRMGLTSATQSQSPIECDWGQLRRRKHQSKLVGGCDTVAGGSGFFIKNPTGFENLSGLVKNNYGCYQLVAGAGVFLAARFDEPAVEYFTIHQAKKKGHRMCDSLL